MSPWKGDSDGEERRVRIGRERGEGGVERREEGGG